MKSVHISTASTWRGGENQLLLLARELVERGKDALVVAPPGAPLVERCREARVPVRELVVRGALGAWRLSRLIRDEEPEFLHAHDGHAVTPAKIAARLAGKKGMALKLVAHRRTVFPIKGKSKYAGRVDAVIAISNAAKAELLKAGIPEQKIRVVYSGMEFPEVSETDRALFRRIFREQRKIPQDAFVIAHAAALTAEKRQSDMLAALLKTQAHLVIAGAGELESELRAKAIALGVHERVCFTGFQRDLRPFWAASDVALFASEAEGLCTALIEAQGAGLPAVVSRAGGMPEVIEDGVTGVIFEIGDVNAMSGAIEELRADNDRRKNMGAKATERAHALFSARAMVRGVVAVYRELKGKDEV